MRSIIPLTITSHGCATLNYGFVDLQKSFNLKSYTFDVVVFDRDHKLGCIFRVLFFNRKLLFTLSQVGSILKRLSHLSRV